MKTLLLLSFFGLFSLSFSRVRKKEYVGGYNIFFSVFSWLVFYFFIGSGAEGDESCRGLGRRKVVLFLLVGIL